MYPQQPIQPVQPIQQPTNFDFTAQQPPAPAPAAPVAPTPDPALSQMQNDIAEIKTALGTVVTPQTTAPEPVQTQEAQKKYDEWGAVFEDVDKRAEALINKKLEERDQQAQQASKQVTEQEQANQQYIEGTVNQLRQAGYLPPVANQFDLNDPGKQAENELLGYTISLGSTDLVSAAKELKFRHDAGFKYDYQNKQFVQVNQPSNDPNANMFGNLPQTPDGPKPQQFQAPQMPQGPVGPQNPYMAPQYPAGFNAPVSSGNSYQGTQGGVPALRNIRNSSYDSLVEQFNRTN